MALGGVLGVPDGRTAVQAGDLYTVLSLAAVAALAEAGGDVGNLDTVLILAAVAALPEYEVCHVSLSRVAATSLMKAADRAVLREDPWTSPKVALYCVTSSASSMKRASVTVPT